MKKLAAAAMLTIAALTGCSAQPANPPTAKHETAVPVQPVKYEASTAVPAVKHAAAPMLQPVKHETTVRNETTVRHGTTVKRETTVRHEATVRNRATVQRETTVKRETTVIHNPAAKHQELPAAAHKLTTDEARTIVYQRYATQDDPNLCVRLVDTEQQDGHTVYVFQVYDAMPGDGNTPPHTATIDWPMVRDDGKVQSLIFGGGWQ